MPKYKEKRTLGWLQTFSKINRHVVCNCETQFLKQVKKKYKYM
jgi:hypothetical protein